MAGSFPPRSSSFTLARNSSEMHGRVAFRGRDGFVFWTFPDRGPEPLAGYVRLAMEGPVISPADADRGLLLLDGTWRLASGWKSSFASCRHAPAADPVRLSPDVANQTRSGGGPATIEALYAAYDWAERATACSTTTTGLINSSPQTNGRGPRRREATAVTRGVGDSPTVI